MSFFEDLKYNIERKKSFAEIQELMDEAINQQTRLRKETKKYAKFVSKNSDFLNELHGVYCGIYQYYQCAYENNIIYRGKYMCGCRFVSPDYEKKFTTLDDLVRDAYYESGFMSKSDKIYWPTPATDKLNEFLKTENKEDFFRYAENRMSMLKNKRFLETDYYPIQKLMEFKKKQKDLRVIFDNIESCSNKLNELNEKVNSKSLSHVAKYDPISYRKVLDRTIPTVNPHLEKNIDYISLIGVMDPELTRQQAIDHARNLKSHIESSSMVKA